MTEPDGSFNGWNNHATWLVHLWLSNEEATSRHVCALEEERRVDAFDVSAGELIGGESTALAVEWNQNREEQLTALADDIKTYVEDGLLSQAIEGHAAYPEFPTWRGLALDALTGFLQDVDWPEVAGAWTEDWPEAVPLPTATIEPAHLVNGEVDNPTFDDLGAGVEA